MMMPSQSDFGCRTKVAQMLINGAMDCLSLEVNPALQVFVPGLWGIA
jgi:hypothetical protein